MSSSPSSVASNVFKDIDSWLPLLLESSSTYRPFFSRMAELMNTGICKMPHIAQTAIVAAAVAASAAAAATTDDTTTTNTTTTIIITTPTISITIIIYIIYIIDTVTNSIIIGI